MNQGKNPAIVRAMYIIVVPVVILIIILNTGLLQRMLPAARMHGHSYTAAQYNYYYFDYYNAFLEENELRLSELGYNPKLSADQQTHASGISWKEFFLRQAEADMAETAYYCDLAAAAGYTFSTEELAPVQERMAENAVFQAASGISAANYYVAYYGRGMTQAVYTAELTRQVKAAAYKAYLAGTATASQGEIDAYLAARTAPDYRTVDLHVVTLDALPDRETGEIGTAQLGALREKLGRLAARYAAGASIEELQEAFSSDALGDADGVLTGATAADLPDCVAQAVLSAQESAQPGQTYSLVDETAGRAYFVLLDGFGASGASQEARTVLGEAAVEAQEAETLAADYAVARLKPGFLLVSG